MAEYPFLGADPMTKKRPLGAVGGRGILTQPPMPSIVPPSPFATGVLGWRKSCEGRVLSELGEMPPATLALSIEGPR